MFFKPKSDKQRGFTLIELLVVISIISLLSSVVLSSLNSARVKASDARHISSLKQLQTALSFYYDQFGSYPSGSGYDYGGSTAFETALTPLVTNNFISKVPHGYNYPNNAWPYAFWYWNGGITCGGIPPNGTYTLVFLSEKSTFNFPVYDVLSQGTRYCVNGSWKKFRKK